MTPGKGQHDNCAEEVHRKVYGTGGSSDMAGNIYEIRVKGRVDRRWFQCYEGLGVTYQAGDTLLSGPIRDQSALHGVLERVRDLNLVLIALKRLEYRKEQADHEIGNRQC
jgi:hypothetical protein